MNISEAIEKLDGNNDKHWTADGLPAVAVIRTLTNDQNVTRQQITDNDPTFNRTEAIRRHSEEAQIDENETWDPEPEAMPESDTQPIEAEPEVSPSAENEDESSSPEAEAEAEKPADPQAEEASENAPLQVLSSADVENHPDNVSELADKHLDQQGNEVQTVMQQRMAAQEHLSEEMRRLDNEIAALNVERDKINRQIEERQGERDRLQGKQQAEHSHISDMEARLQFIESQKKEREQKAARAEEIKRRVGIIPSDVDPRCPLDKALQMKPNKQTMRPIDRQHAAAG